MPGASPRLWPEAAPRDPKTTVTLENLGTLLKIFPTKNFLLTEYGVQTAASGAFSGQHVDQATQADYLHRAYVYVARYKQVKLLMWYLLKDYAPARPAACDRRLLYGPRHGRRRPQARLVCVCRRHEPHLGRPREGQAGYGGQADRYVGPTRRGLFRQAGASEPPCRTAVGHRQDVHHLCHRTLHTVAAAPDFDVLPGRLARGRHEPPASGHRSLRRRRQRRRRPLRAGRVSRRRAHVDRLRLWVSPNRGSVEISSSKSWRQSILV